jgi:pimeloyl-ACP methyl ester carboxylesterase
MAHPRWPLPVVLVAALLGACDSEPTAPSASSSSPTQVASPPSSVLDVPTVDGSFRVDASGSKAWIRCYGSGGPTIVLEAGDDSSGLDVFPPTMLEPLAGVHRTCVYERLGVGHSDRPPERRRSLDDVVAVLRRLLGRADVPPPYLLVGSSGGGNIVVQYAERHPVEVAGLVLLDVPRPSPDLGLEFPGPLGWKNPEHIDWVTAERDQSELRMPLGGFPVLILTAEGGQSNRNDQAYWLDLSAATAQVVVPGDHDFYQAHGQETAQRILGLAEKARLASIVGVWRRETTCEQRVAALEKAGLGRLAARSVTGDGFIPGASSPADPQDRSRPCLGAIPFTHYHFFSADGQFGSLDQDHQQVDDGPYEVLGPGLIRIGSDGGGVRYKYAVTGNHLRLWPVLPACARVGCFDAEWSVAVSYLGLPWTRAADDLMP